MEELARELNEKTANYTAYLLPALCFVLGVLVGFVLSPVKSGKVSILSGNSIGSGNRLDITGNKSDKAKNNN